MGDPRFPRRRYDPPSHPWKYLRIDEEKIFKRKFGLKNNREVWKAKAILGRIRGQARHLQARLRTGNPQAVRENEQLIRRVNRMGFVETEATGTSDLLVLDLEAVLNRRLQSMVYLKGLARTPDHARQMIVHGHISVRGRRVTIPSYLVPRAEEEDIDFAVNSPLSHDLHPMRPENIGGPSTQVEEAVPDPVEEAPTTPTGTEEGAKAGKAATDEATTEEVAAGEPDPPAEEKTKVKNRRKVDEKSAAGG